MKQIIAILLMSLFAAGCTLGVPIIDGKAAQDNSNTGSDKERPDRPGKDGGRPN